jgi:dienelactone hydrolase
MRNRCFCVLPLLFLVWQGPVFAQQGGAAGGKKAQKQDDLKVGPANKGENWQVLDDVKSGLQSEPPFVFQKDDEPEFVREMVRVEWRSGDPIDLYVMRPKTSGKVPVVLYLYSYPGDPASQFSDNGWAKRATAGGVAAAGFASALTGQRYRFRPLKQWFISELPESLGSSVHDVQLVLNYLAGRGDMDMNHVGVFGMGSGASIYPSCPPIPESGLVDIDPWRLAGVVARLPGSARRRALEVYDPGIPEIGCHARPGCLPAIVENLSPSGSTNVN